MLQKLNKKQKRANRLAQLLTHTNNTRDTLPLIQHSAVEWLVYPNKQRILNPDSKLGSLLYADPSVLQSLRNFTRRHSVDRNNWESVLLKVRTEQEGMETLGAHNETSLHRYKLVEKLIETLSSNGVSPQDARSLKQTIQTHREYYRRATTRLNGNEFQSKVQQFKESWNTMRPQRVKDNFLPHGEAIGVELEWIAPCRVDDDDNYNRDCMDFERPDDIWGTSWGYDSSIRDFQEHQYRQGQETRVMLRYGNWNRLHQVCDYIKDNGGEVNKSCGVHVHLDTRHISRAATITRGKRLGSAVAWLKLLVPKSRAKSTYCKGTFSTTEKYQAVTMHNYTIGRECVEVRLHSGSLNANKIVNWIELLHYIKNHYNHLGTWEEFLQSGCPLHLKMWAINRKEKFNPTVQPEADIESEQIEELPDPLPQLPDLPPSMDDGA